MLYQLADEAIRRRLYVKEPGHVCDSGYRRVVEIELGFVVIEAEGTGSRWRRNMTPEQFDALAAEGGLWARVGTWDFVRADHPALEDIRYCYNYPQSAGQELFDLRAQLDALKKQS